MQHAQAIEPSRFLRPCKERPSDHRAAEQRDEVAPFRGEHRLLKPTSGQIGHVISSLAETITGNEQRNIIDGGLGNDTLMGSTP
jgi:hypothetical protein